MFYAKSLAVCALLCFFPSMVYAQALWVSDALTTYVRSGPSDGHRIVGALSAGEAVTLVRQSNQYSEILLENGKKVWILSKDLKNEPAAHEQVPALKAKVAELQDALDQHDENWQVRVQGLEETLAARASLIDELNAQNQALVKQLGAEQSALREAQAQLGSEQRQLLMQYLVYGGGIAGVGLVLGLLLPLATRAKKRSNEWV